MAPVGPYEGIESLDRTTWAVSFVGVMLQTFFHCEHIWFAKHGLFRSDWIIWDQGCFGKVQVIQNFESYGFAVQKGP